MKSKPVLIITVVIVAIAACGFILIRSKNTTSANKKEVLQFLAGFKNQVLANSRTDTLLSYFKKGQDTNKVTEVLFTIPGRPIELEESRQEFNIDFNTDKAEVKFINPQLAEAKVPITFRTTKLPNKFSSVTFTVEITGHHQYKIDKMDGRYFLIAYQNYQNYLDENEFPDKDIYSPVTLNAFKQAKLLHAKYDSVVWISHLNGKNWFYVINGKWDVYKAFRNEKDTAKTYKMGLVDPQFKEVIPVAFDVVHNISGTLPNLIEVEKDHKKGLYDLAGKQIVPVEYDRLIPVRDSKNLAALQKGDDYFWLRNDYTISEKADIKIADVLAKLKQTVPFTFAKNPGPDVVEFNSRRMHESVYLPPSYLVDLGLMYTMELFKNPLRRKVYVRSTTESYEVTNEPKRAVDGGGNWLTSMFYNIKEYYLSGRLGFYNAQNVVIVDNKRNKVYSATVNNEFGHDERGESTKSSVKALNDSLFEVVVPSSVSLSLYNGDIVESMPLYHYLGLQKGHLAEQSTGRLFGFTKFRKMDDSYITGNYLYQVKVDSDTWNDKQIKTLNQYALQYMKNEIYASYNYNFKDAKWADLFGNRIPNYKAKNANVDDSLTAIDKFNINFINSKLNANKGNTLAAK